MLFSLWGSFFINSVSPHLICSLFSLSRKQFRVLARLYKNDISSIEDGDAINFPSIISTFIIHPRRKSPLKLLRDVVASIGPLGWLAPPTDDPFGKPCRARTRDRATYQSQRSEVFHLLPLPLSQWVELGGRATRCFYVRTPTERPAVKQHFPLMQSKMENYC